MMKQMGLIVAMLLLLSLSSYAEDLSRGGVLFQKCVGCHGQDGKNKAFGKSAILAGQLADDLIESLTFYKESEFKAHSSTAVMAKQVKALSTADVIDLATYISKLQK